MTWQNGRVMGIRIPVPVTDERAGSPSCIPELVLAHTVMALRDPPFGWLPRILSAMPSFLWPVFPSNFLDTANLFPQHTVGWLLLNPGSGSKHLANAACLVSSSQGKRGTPGRLKKLCTLQQCRCPT